MYASSKTYALSVFFVFYIFLIKKDKLDIYACAFGLHL